MSTLDALLALLAAFVTALAYILLQIGRGLWRELRKGPVADPPPARSVESLFTDPLPEAPLGDDYETLKKQHDALRVEYNKTVEDLASAGRTLRATSKDRDLLKAQGDAMERKLQRYAVLLPNVVGAEDPFATRQFHNPVERYAILYEALLAALVDIQKGMLMRYSTGDRDLRVGRHVPAAPHPAEVRDATVAQLQEYVEAVKRELAREVYPTIEP